MNVESERDIMVVFDRRKQYMGYKVVKSFFEQKHVDGYGLVKVLIRLIDVKGDIRRVASFHSHAIAFYKYESKSDMVKRGTSQYRELKKRYPECTPHHDLDGFKIVPMSIHRAFRHTGPIYLTTQ